MSRNLLHKSKLAAFRCWLTAQGIEHRPPRGDYEVLQVQAKAPAWFCVFDRHAAKEHYTVDVRLEPTVRRFIRENKASAASAAQGDAITAAWLAGRTVQYLVRGGYDDQWTDYAAATHPDTVSNRLAWRVKPAAQGDAQ